MRPELARVRQELVFFRSSPTRNSSPSRPSERHLSVLRRGPSRPGFPKAECNGIAAKSKRPETAPGPAAEVSADQLRKQLARSAEAIRGLMDAGASQAPSFDLGKILDRADVMRIAHGNKAPVTLGERGPPGISGWLDAERCLDLLGHAVGSRWTGEIRLVLAVTDQDIAQLEPSTTCEGQ